MALKATLATGQLKTGRLKTRQLKRHKVAMRALLLPCLLATGLITACRPAPERPPLEVAENYVREGKYREANLELMSALQRTPDDPKLVMLRGNVLLKLGNNADAEKSYLTAQKLGVAPSAVAPLLARAQLNQRKAKDALATLASIDTAEAFHMRGQAQLLLNQPDLARAELDRGIAKYPTNADLLALRARISLRQQNLPDAQAFAKRALTANPKNIDALLVTADGLRLAGNNAAALQHYDHVLKLAPRNVTAKLGMMAILSAIGDEDRLIPLIDELVVLAPNNPDVIIAKARQLIADGNDEEANLLLRNKTAIIASRPAALMAAGEIALQQNYVSLAIDRFEQLLRLSPNDPKVRYMLARAYLADGDPNSARRTLAPVVGNKDFPQELRAVVAQMPAPTASPAVQNAAAPVPPKAMMPVK